MTSTRPAGPVVVTGVSSFIGLNLARAFAAAGHVVVGTHSRPVDAYDGIAGDRLKVLAPHVRFAKA